MALLEAGLAAGIDFAYSHDIESWDEMSVPLSFLLPEATVPVVTVYTNCAAPPLPLPRRCLEVGAFVGDFVRASAAPGARGAARHRRAFPLGGHAGDRPHQPRLGPLGARPHRPRRHRRRSLASRADEIERDGGNGGQEIRNWIALLGAVPGLEGRGARLRAGGGVDHRLRDGVGAPVIAISYALNKLLTAIARQHQMKERLTEEDMAGHALSDAERTALQRRRHRQALRARRQPVSHQARVPAPLHHLTP